jgi:hypothetical protein
VTREEFDEALLRYGANLERWPRDTAVAARRLVASDPVAARMQVEAAAFERTVADAVRPPAFGAPEIGAVLAALPEAKEGWGLAPRVWLTGAAGVSVLSFVAGFLVMRASLASHDVLGVPLTILGLAMGQADIGGLL